MAAALLSAAVPAALADLRSTTLDSLLRDSEWITVARVESVTPGEHGAGQAQLTPLQTLRGEGSDGPFALHWSDEVHDQRVPAPPAQVLVFLKRRSGAYVAAQYGRSLWLLESQPLAGSRCARYVRWRYPLDMLRLTAAQRQRLLQRAGTPKQPILCLDDPSTLLSPAAERTPR